MLHFIQFNLFCDNNILTSDPNIVKLYFNSRMSPQIFRYELRHETSYNVAFWHE